MAGGVPGERTLQETPTWAVAVVIGVFIIVSVLIEQGIHSLEKWFQKRHKKAMSEALEKIKAELMLLGFISLLLTFGTNYIAKICIPEKLGDTMLPCKKVKLESDDDPEHRRRLLSFDENVEWRRVLAATSTGVNEYCSKKGKVPLISQSGVHQLHINIFVLAVIHIFYSVMTMALARAKMNKWKAWEAETSSQEYQFTNDPARFRFTHQTSFVMRHSGRWHSDMSQGGASQLVIKNDMSPIRSMDQRALKGLGGSKTRARAKKDQEVLNQIVSTLMETSPSSSLDGVEDKMVTYLIQLEDP